MTASSSPVTPSPAGALLAVRVVPGARKSEMAEMAGEVPVPGQAPGQAPGRLRIRLQAPPVEGKANRELLRFLARALGLKKNRISLERGERSRDKVVLLHGVSAAEAEAMLKTALTRNKESRNNPAIHDSKGLKKAD